MDAIEIQQILQGLIPVAGIVFGTLLVGFVFAKIAGLIKAWINRKNSTYDEEAFDRLAKAFIQHKKDTQRRLQNLEAIVTDEDAESTPASSSNKQLNDSRSHRRIEIESDHSDTKKEEEQTDSGRNLKNMLNKSGTSS